MLEKIGKVNLNYQYYSGEDLYSDGDIEDKLLDIVKNNSPYEYDEVIKKEKSWPVLYHLSSIRENIINWYEFKKDAEVLEVGAGCGAISGILSKQAKHVTAIELSKKRSLINANKNKNCDNLDIVVGNFNDIAPKLNKKFDYVTLIGVLEYAESYMPGNNSTNSFLEEIKKLLKPNGKVIIAIENQLGLKYFAGCKEDHVGILFEGIEGYSNTKGIKTYSKKRLTDIIMTAGFDNLQYYYPYPDYKFPDRIYSDCRLPHKGELTLNIRNYDADRVVLFDESKAFDTLIEAGLFTELSNSFLIIADRI